jgi:hypothetical protein
MRRWGRSSDNRVPDREIVAPFRKLRRRERSRATAADEKKPAIAGFS